MECVLRKPGPPLDEMVDVLWALNDAPAHACERIVPGGTFELVVNLDQDEVRVYDDDGTVRRHRGAVVSGAYSRSFVVDTREHACMLGVHFKPGAAPALLRDRADALADAHVELDELWPRSTVASLRDRLCSATTAVERLRLLERVLRERLDPARAPRSFLRAVLSDPGRSLRETAAVVGRSQRSFIQGFREEVGLTPKLFLRIQRFERAFALARANSALGWTELALGCGYCDQSHLIRDFVAFAGLTPAAVARGSAVPAKAGHIPLA